MTDTVDSIRAEDFAAEVAERQRRTLLDEAIVLEYVSGRAWRVCDSRCRPGSGGRFLGFIEERNGGSELMQETESFIWTTFDSMRDALDHVVLTNEQVADRRQLRKPPEGALPPSLQARRQLSRIPESSLARQSAGRNARRGRIP